MIPLNTRSSILRGLSASEGYSEILPELTKRIDAVEARLPESDKGSARAVKCYGKETKDRDQAKEQVDGPPPGDRATVGEVTAID